MLPLPKVSELFDGALTVNNCCIVHFHILYHFDPMFASRVTGVLEHWGSRVPGGSELPVVEGYGR